MVDYFSRFPEAIKLTSVTSRRAITALKSVFSRYGILEILVSDNSPQFASQEFTEFASAYNAERAVKKLLKSSDDPYLSLLFYHATPLPWCIISPKDFKAVMTLQIYPR